VHLRVLLCGSVCIVIVQDESASFGLEVCIGNGTVVILWGPQNTMVTGTENVVLVTLWDGFNLCGVTAGMEIAEYRNTAVA